MSQPKASNLDGKEIDAVSSVKLDAISKNDGAYFVWACIPQSGKIAMRTHLVNNEAWKHLLNAMNALIDKSSGGKVELVLREK